MKPRPAKEQRKSPTRRRLWPPLAQVKSLSHQEIDGLVVVWGEGRLRLQFTNLTPPEDNLWQS